MQTSFSSRSFGHSGKAVFLLAGWKVKYYQFWLFAKILEWAGFQCILYVFNDDFFSPDIEQTAANFHKAQNEILGEIERLRNKGVMNISIFGVSLGSALAFMVADRSRAVSKIIINMSGLDMVQSVWGWGEKTNPEFRRHFRRANITLSDLQKGWFDINPKNNIANIKNRNILLYLSERDEIIPYAEGLVLADSLKKNNHLRVMVSKRLNHFYAAVKNMFLFPRYINFYAPKYDSAIIIS